MFAVITGTLCSATQMIATKFQSSDEKLQLIAHSKKKQKKKIDITEHTYKYKLQRYKC